MYKFPHDILPLSISQLYTKNFSVHNHNNRNKDLLRISMTLEHLIMSVPGYNNILISQISLKLYLLHNSLTITYSTMERVIVHFTFVIDIYNCQSTAHSVNYDQVINF